MMRGTVWTGPPTDFGDSWDRDEGYHEHLDYPMGRWITPVGPDPVCTDEMHRFSKRGGLIP